MTIYPDHINHSEYLDTSLKTMPRDVSVDTEIMRSYDNWVRTVRVDCVNLSVTRLEYDTICLVAETGEVLDEMKKLLRDNTSPEELRENLLLECGDCLHYLSRILEDIGSSLQEAASANVEKLTNRSLYGKGNRGKRS